MSDSNEQRTDETNSLQSSRRDLLKGGIATAGLLALGSNSASAQESGVGGGPADDPLAQHRVKKYRASMADRPAAGVAGREFEVFDPDDEENHGKVFVDDGSQWHLVNRKVGSLSTEEEDIGELWRDVKDGSEIQTAAEDLVDFSARPNQDVGEGGSIRLTKNLTPVSEEIDIPGGVTLKGANVHGSVIEATDDFTGDAVLKHAPPGSGDNVKEFFLTFEDIKINGNQENVTAKGLWFTDSDGANPQDVLMDRVFVAGCQEEGILFEQTWGYKVENYLVEGCGFGSDVNAAMSVRGDQSHYRDGFIMKNRADHGLVVAGGSARTIFDILEIRNNEEHGANIDSTTTYLNNIIVQGNGQSSDGVYSGIRLRGDNCRITNGLFDGRSVTKFGINLSSSHNLIKNCWFQGHTDAPVRISDAVTTEFNTFVNCKGLSFDSFAASRGTRTIIDGTSLNAGNPATEGEWNGYAQDAWERGVTVFDETTSPYTPYWAVPDGSGGYSWQQVSTTAA